MESWKIQAFLAAFFAGITAVLAKAGMSNLSADIALVVRTSVVCVIVIGNASLLSGGNVLARVRQCSAQELCLLGLSGVTAALSWIFYFRAVKSGSVGWVAMVDKGSILVTLFFSFWFLHEPLTPRVALGAGLIMLGIIVLSYK